MNRNDMLRKLEDTKDWDFIIIDGSANGLGTAIEDSTRGYKTLLLKQSDFAKEISTEVPNLCMVECLIYNKEILILFSKLRKSKEY